jgi:LPXTG-motif cell wall-anchored protein
MAVSGERGNPLINKLAALVAIIFGFLLAAEGYRSSSNWLIVAGIAVLAVGLILLVMKIARRNEGA